MYTPFVSDMDDKHIMFVGWTGRFHRLFRHDRASRHFVACMLFVLAWMNASALDTITYMEPQYPHSPVARVEVVRDGMDTVRIVKYLDGVRALDIDFVHHEVLAFGKTNHSNDMLYYNQRRKLGKHEVIWIIEPGTENHWQRLNEWEHGYKVSFVQGKEVYRGWYFRNKQYGLEKQCDLCDLPERTGCEWRVYWTFSHNWPLNTFLATCLWMLTGLVSLFIHFHGMRRKRLTFLWYFLAALFVGFAGDLALGEADAAKLGLTTTVFFNLSLFLVMRLFTGKLHPLWKVLAWTILIVQTLILWFLILLSNTDFSR